MELDKILYSAHIHLDHSVYRVYVEDSSLVDVRLMNEDYQRPKFVTSVYRSNDPARSQTSILVDVNEEFEMQELADWVNSYL